MEHVLTISESELEVERQKVTVMLALLSDDLSDQDVGLALMLGKLVSVDRIIQQKRYAEVIADLFRENMEEADYERNATLAAFRFEGIRFSNDVAESLATVNALASEVERMVIQLAEAGKKAAIIGLLNVFNKVVQSLSTPKVLAVSVSIMHILSAYICQHPEVIRDITGDDDDLFELVMGIYQAYA